MKEAKYGRQAKTMTSTKCKIVNQPWEKRNNNKRKDNSTLVLTFIIALGIFTTLMLFAHELDNPNTDKIEETNKNITETEATTTRTAKIISTNVVDEAPKEITSNQNVAELQIAEVKAENESDTIQTCETLRYNASEEEKIAIACVIHAEARGESYDGKVAVGATILNRYFSDIQMFKGKSIMEIITQPYQYSYYEVPKETLEENGCLEAANAALRGEDPTRKVFPETGAIFFYNPDHTSEYQLSIRTGINEMIIGSHHFHVDFNTNA